MVGSVLCAEGCVPSMVGRVLCAEGCIPQGGVYPGLGGIPNVHPGYVPLYTPWYTMVGIHLSLLYPTYHPGYTTVRMLHPGHVHPAAHGVRVSDNETLGSTGEKPVGEGLSASLMS